jgi:hypothetical protein
LINLSSLIAFQRLELDIIQENCVKNDPNVEEYIRRACPCANCIAEYNKNQNLKREEEIKKIVDLAERLHQKYPLMILHTLGCGEEVDSEVLERIASTCGGNFYMIRVSY